LNCPLCQSALHAITALFSGRAYVCAAHGIFGVAQSAWDQFAALDATHQASALACAKERMRSATYPIITADDLAPAAS